MPCFSVFVDQTNLKTNRNFSLSHYRCHETPIDVENRVKKCIKLKSQKTKFYGDYRFRSAHAAKHVCLAVFTN